MPGTMVPWMDPKLLGHRTLACLYGPGKLAVTRLYDKQEHNSVSVMELEGDKLHIQAILYDESGPAFWRVSIDEVDVYCCPP